MSKPVRLTARGKIVLTATAFIASAIIGFTTANYCWYGYCGL